MGYPSFNVGDVLTAADMNAVGLWKITNCTATTVGAGSSATVTNGTVTISGNATSVTISSAFSSSFDNYRIILSGGSGSTAQFLSLQLGASGTGYYYAGVGSTYAADALNYNRTNAGASWAQIGASYPDGNNLDVTLYGPQKSTQKTGIAQSGRIDFRTTGSVISGGAGYHDVAAAYTAFTIAAVGGGTFTGCRIRIYGFQD